MSGHRRNEKELKGDFQKFVGELSEHKPRRNASEWMHRKPYQAVKMIREQGKQIEHYDALGYINKVKGSGNNGKSGEVGK